MSIIKNLGYKQRIVILISITLAVISRFLPEPTPVHEPLLPSQADDYVSEPVITSPQPSMEQIPEEQALPAELSYLPGEPKLALQLHDVQPLERPITPAEQASPAPLEQSSTANSSDLFTITPATPDLFPREWPHTLPIHHSQPVKD